NGEVQAWGIHLSYRQYGIQYNGQGQVTGYRQSVSQIEHYQFVRQVQKGFKRKMVTSWTTGMVTAESNVQVLEYDGYGRQIHTVVESQRNDRNRVWSRTDTRIKSFDAQGRALDVERHTESKLTVVGKSGGLWGKIAAIAVF